MRNTFVKEITELAKNNKKIVILAGDIGYKLFDDFIKKYPKRFYNCGVAEANMTTVAAGLALKGYTPITYTIATFNVYKTIEQIKIDVCYPNLGVIIVGVGAGLSYADLGSTHHATEDIGILRSIPNLSIVSPADPFELKSLMPQLVKSKKPTYLRIGKRGEKNVYKNYPKVKLGKGKIILRGSKVCIIASGNIIVNAHAAILELRKKNINPTLISIHTIKPIDKNLLDKVFKNYKHIVILEEHTSIGGLAGAISEYYLSKQFKNKFLTLNTGKDFIMKSGRQNSAYEKMKISPKHIEKRILNFLKK